MVHKAWAVQDWVSAACLGQDSAAFWATLQLVKELSASPTAKRIIELVKCQELVQLGLEKLVFAKGGSQIGSSINWENFVFLKGTGIILSQARQQKFIVTEWGALPILTSRTLRQE